MPNLSDLKRETYLGDGLYASFDTYGIRLRRAGTHFDHNVYLSLGSVLPAFLAYVDDLKIKIANHLKDEAKDQGK